MAKRFVLHYFFKKKQTGHVALAGKTGGAVRVCLDFFVAFFIKKKSKEK